jgi:hypothetical protein
MPEHQILLATPYKSLQRNKIHLILNKIAHT